VSRARDMANLGTQAGSGLDASDITTGTLGNTVQDNITRLGTVTTGTINTTIGSSATGGSGLTAHGRIGHYIHLKLASSPASQTGAGVIDVAKTQLHNTNTDLFEHDTTNHGIKIKTAGNYLFIWGIYTYSTSNSSNQVKGYTEEKLYNYRTSAVIEETYQIYIRDPDEDAYTYNLSQRAYVMDCVVNDVFSPWVFISSGTYTINEKTHIKAVYLGS